MAGRIILNKVSATATNYAIKCASVLEQGNFGVMGRPDASGVRTVTAPGAITTANVVVHLSVPLVYDANKSENDFKLEIGEIGRAYVPYQGMGFCIPVANILATVAVAKDAHVIIDATSFVPECVASLGGTESIAFIVEDVFTDNGVSMAQLLCIKA